MLKPNFPSVRVVTLDQPASFWRTRFGGIIRPMRIAGTVVLGMAPLFAILGLIAALVLSAVAG